MKHFNFLRKCSSIFSANICFSLLFSVLSCLVYRKTIIFQAMTFQFSLFQDSIRVRQIGSRSIEPLSGNFHRLSLFHRNNCILYLSINSSINNNINLFSINNIILFFISIFPSFVIAIRRKIYSSRLSFSFSFFLFLLYIKLFTHRFYTHYSEKKLIQR